MKTRPVVGEVYRFRAAYDRAHYGELARVAKVQRVVSRPFGRETTLVDFVTTVGTRIQWRLAIVRSRMDLTAVRDDVVVWGAGR